MQIQKIQSAYLKTNLKQNNNISFQRKIVQPDSFINAPKRKKKSKNNILEPFKQFLFRNKDGLNPLMAASALNLSAKNREIYEYFHDSKEELRAVEVVADAHRRQFLAIYKKAEKRNFKNMDYENTYRISYSDVDPKTKKPSLINVWQDGKFIHQYKINSLNPLNLEVYDCEFKEDLIEEYLIEGKKLREYCAKMPQTGEAQVIIPLDKGFYKIEGEMNPKGDYVCEGAAIKKKTALRYDPDGYSYYTEYNEENAQRYEYDKKTKIWK